MSAVVKTCVFNHDVDAYIGIDEGHIQCFDWLMPFGLSLPIDFHGSGYTKQLVQRKTNIREFRIMVSLTYSIHVTCLDCVPSMCRRSICGD